MGPQTLFELHLGEADTYLPPEMIKVSHSSKTLKLCGYIMRYSIDYSESYLPIRDSHEKAKIQMWDVFTPDSIKRWAESEAKRINEASKRETAKKWKGWKFKNFVDGEKKNTTPINDTDVLQIIPKLQKVREKILIPAWEQYAEYTTLNQLGASQIRKGLPIIFYSTDINDETLTRCNPEKLSHGGHGWGWLPKYSQYRFSDRSEFDDGETKYLGDIKTIELGVNSKIYSEFHRTEVHHDGLCPGSLVLSNRCFRAPADIAHSLFPHVLLNLADGAYFVARGMFYQGIDNEGGLYRVAVVDTHGDVQTLLKNKNVLDVLKETKERYNLNLMGFLHGKHPGYERYGSYHDVEPHPYWTFKVEDLDAERDPNWNSVIVSGHKLTLLDIDNLPNNLEEFIDSPITED